MSVSVVIRFDIIFIVDTYSFYIVFICFYMFYVCIGSLNKIKIN